MIHVIIQQGIHDKEFVEKWTTVFEELKAHVSPFTPQLAGKITWIKAEDIVLAARTYALNKPAIIDWGVAIEQNPNFLQTVRAISLLRGLTGNIDVPGGDILGMNIIRSDPTLKEK
jgi:anaerobic selenocysteine-containing dehydrogenase